MNAARSSKTLFSFQAMAPSKAMPLYTHPCLRIVSPPMYPDRTRAPPSPARGEGSSPEPAQDVAELLLGAGGGARRAGGGGGVGRAVALAEEAAEPALRDEALERVDVE